MINKLKFSVKFQSTGRTIKGDHTFSKGMTSITGPNETGKSMRVEMIRYALFGTKALRANAAQYKSLSAELEFTVQGKKYKVVRSPSKTLLTTGSTELATGTKPVNEKIITILGYDLKVFDIANACNQGDVEGLSDMRPTQRKEMVDQTIGLNAFDEISSDLQDQIKARKAALEAYNDGLVEPEIPDEPNNYRKSEDVKAALEHVKTSLRRANQLQGWLSAAPEEPGPPPACPDDRKIEDLQDLQDKRASYGNQVSRIKNQLAKYPSEVPTYTIRDLDEMDIRWATIKEFNERDKLLDRGEHTCPECSHSWPVASTELAEYDHLPAVRPEDPELSIAEIKKAREAIVSFESVVALREEMEGAIEKYAAMEDHSSTIDKLRKWQTVYSLWEAKSSEYDKYLEEKAAVEAELAGITVTNDDYAALEVAHTEASVYEATLQAYDLNYQKYEARKEKIAELEDKITDLENARKALKTLKVKVKGYLVPSLNKVASGLLSQMTNDARNSIVVSEDFEIEADGQPIETLSGSGKAVVNLAIRLGLGRVLTNKVFSVFMGDEVDASMDDDRAAYVSECLTNLSSVLDQVILVSHKDPTADHYIKLS